MSGMTVHILTTEGPVAIQRITEEDNAVQSVICLDGLTQILPISPHYEAFVRRPAGVIERMTGHGAYRMDVSARIDEGRSWQLAAFLAHAARQQGGGQDVTVFATGEVDRDLAVRRVEHVEQKLQALTRHLAEFGVAPERAVIMVPEGSGTVPEQIAGIPVCAVADIGAALALAELAPLASAPAKDPREEKIDAPRRRNVPFTLLIGAALIAAALFWVSGDFARWSALMQQGRLLELEQDLARAETDGFGQLRAGAYLKWLGLSASDAPAPALQGALYTAADAAQCTEPSAQVKRPLHPVYKDADSICRVEVRAIGDAATVHIGRLAYWPTGLGNADRPSRVMRGSQETSGRTWVLAFDEKPQPGAALRLVVISGAVDINGPQPWYQDLLSAPLSGPAFDAAKARLQRFGFTVTALDWRRE